LLGKLYLERKKKKISAGLPLEYIPNQEKKNSSDSQEGISPQIDTKYFLDDSPNISEKCIIVSLKKTSENKKESDAQNLNFGSGTNADKNRNTLSVPHAKS